RSHRELAPGSARADPELDSSSPRQAHTPRPQDVRPAATLRARPRRVPSRASLPRAPQSSASRRLSILRAHAREPRPSEPSTVVLPSSPAPSKAPTPDVARCSALHLISHSCMSKQRPARRRTINIRPQPLCAGSGFKTIRNPEFPAMSRPGANGRAREWGDGGVHVHVRTWPGTGAGAGTLKGTGAGAGAGTFTGTGTEPPRTPPPAVYP